MPLTVPDPVSSCLVKFEIHQTFDPKASNIGIVLVFDVRCFVRLAVFTKNVWRAHLYYDADFWSYASKMADSEEVESQETSETIDPFQK